MGLEPAPNGGRINIGADGGTPQASKSAAASRSLALLSPIGGELWQGSQRVEWHTDGAGWQSGDTLRFEYSADAGQTWQALPDASAVPYGQGKLWWDTRPLSNGYGYRLRLTCVQDGEATSQSQGVFTLANAGRGAVLLHVAPGGSDDRSCA